MPTDDPTPTPRTPGPRPVPRPPAEPLPTAQAGILAIRCPMHDVPEGEPCPNAPLGACMDRIRRAGYGYDPTGNEWRRAVTLRGTLHERAEAIRAAERAAHAHAAASRRRDRERRSR